MLRATLHTLRDFAGKLMLPSRQPSPPAQVKPWHPQTVTNLKQRLAQLGITQSQFAELCGVHRNTVGNWANDRRRMNHTAGLVLEVLEAHDEAARYVASARSKRAPRGRSFKPGNPYRFGDKRRAIHVAGAQLARAAA